MASSIVPGNIDGTFPIAGQDNSSQGFRDNFTATKNNFTTTKSEIEALQTSSVANNVANSFNDNIVSRAVLKDTAETVFGHGTATLGRIILDITYANTSHTITIPSTVLVADNVTGGDGSSNTITIGSIGRYMYEFMSPDGGTTILMHQLGKMYD